MKQAVASPADSWELLAGPPQELRRLADGCCSEPHRILGAHPARYQNRDGCVIRTWHPEAGRVDCLLPDGTALPMMPTGPDGLFVAFAPGVRPPLHYRLRLKFPDGNIWEREDPYRFLPTLGDLDLHLFNEGKHRRIWDVFGARVREVDGVRGVSFAVWAPNAARVSVVGDFCYWDGRVLPMRQMGSSGVFELFVPGVEPGVLYKYEIKTRTGDIRIKADPYGRFMEHSPGTATRIFESRHAWNDDEWMRRRETTDATRAPMLVYEVHLGSWRWHQDGRPLTYREIAPQLVEHVKRFGFTHIEPLPVSEHPFGGSWGYQVSGYYAPTARFGDPDDFRWFIDYCHQHDVGVIVDWVPAHFPKDDFALRLFDGTALYEHDDPRRGEHPDWGTLIFNYGRNEVKNFLIGSALYWLRELHVDGLRVDAVASMLYLDYSRKAGEWIPNRYGGREDLDAIAFLQELNETIRHEAPGAIMVAEESTAWGGVTRPAGEGGLGFTFKWNMGWMHDTLLYFSKNPVHRRYHHNDITFSMIYEHTERFVMPLSHDEVVHGKGALLEKMPGDLWQKFANLRTLLCYQYLRPGKKLLFMGTELAPWYEWNYEWPLDWSLSEHPERRGLQRMLEDLGRFYRETPTLWRNDPDAHGYSWIDCHDCDNCVLSFLRRDGDRYVVVMLNLTPVPRDGYRFGVPAAGRYVLRVNSDDAQYAGSGYPTSREVWSEPISWHGFAQSIAFNLPPLSALAFTPEA